jgi:hypothetical protein
MIKISVNVDSEILEQLANRMPGLFREGFVAPETQNAFSEAAGKIQKRWIRWAMGGPIDGIPNIKVPNGKLSSSIKINPNGPFDVNIETASPYAKRIQEGTPELDMKTTHPYGPRSRVSKKGIPYLIVPFRWGTEKERAHFGNFIPHSIYQKQALKMIMSYKTGKTHTEDNYRGQPVERDEYEWGSRLLAEGNLNGAVRMFDDTKSKNGGPKSTYFTFRIISAAQIVTNPRSWIRKAVPPIDVVGALKRTMQPEVERIIQAGLEADIQNGS